MSMKTHTLKVILTALATSLFALAAAAQNIKPGQYEYVTKTEMMGMSIPVTFKQCVTQKDIDSNSAYVNQKGAEGCTPPEVKRSGNQINVKFSCSQPKMTGTGTGTVAEDGFSMLMNVTQHDMNNAVVKTQLSAKRLGSC